MTRTANYRGTALRHRPEIFTSVEAAQLSLRIGGYVKPMWLVLGHSDDDGAEALLVCPADAQRLMRAGYELV